jgi:hypothetical protein
MLVQCPCAWATLGYVGYPVYVLWFACSQWFLIWLILASRSFDCGHTQMKILPETCRVHQIYVFYYIITWCSSTYFKWCYLSFRCPDKYVGDRCQMIDTTMIFKSKCACLIIHEILVRIQKHFTILQKVKINIKLILINNVFYLFYWKKSKDILFVF